MALITITETTPNPPIHLAEGSTATLRGYYTQRFLDSDGVTVVMSGDGQTGFYYEFACTVNDDDELVIPAFEIHTTDDGVDVQTSLFIGRLFIDGAPDRIVFGQPQAVGGWIISASLGSSTSWAALDIFNQGRALVASNLYTYLTAAMTAALIQVLSVQTIEALDDLTIDTTGLIQFGDISQVGNSSYIDVDDDNGRADLFAGGAAGEQYAGVAAACDESSAELFLQTTDYTNVLIAGPVTTLGDAQSEHNGTQVRIDDDANMVISRTMNAVPDDDKVHAEEACFYLEEASDKLKVRIRKSDGTYATGEIVYVND